MTLLEAFRNFGPVLGDPGIDSVREQAGQILLQELNRLARATTFSKEIKDDIPSDVIASLMGNAAGGTRSTDPDTDAGVRAWLWVCLNNAAVTRWRKAKRLRTDTEVETTPAPGLSQEQSLVLSEEREERQAAQRQLLTEIAPTIAETFRREEQAAAFIDSVRDLDELAAGRTTMTDVAMGRKGSATKRSFAALYQQHSRARDRLSKRIDQMASSGELTPDRTRHLRACVRRLHRRASHQ